MAFIFNQLPSVLIMTWTIILEAWLDSDTMKLRDVIGDLALLVRGQVTKEPLTFLSASAEHSTAQPKVNDHSRKDHQYQQYVHQIKHQPVATK